MADQLQVISAALSDKGRKRDNNEDYVLFFEPGDERTLAVSGNLYIVADGVGGEARGEFASRFAAEKVLYEYYTRTQELPSERLRQGMELANREIQDFTRDTQSAKMATTLVAAVLIGDKLTIANIGDSRAYLYREGRAEQITRDHNLVGEMVASGLMTEEEGEKSDVKNRLLRSVGGHPDFKPEFFINMPVRPGDRILLCTDGLTRYARKETIEEYLKGQDINEVVKKLVQYAYDAGGADNITALLVEIRPAPAGYRQPQRGTTPKPVALKELMQVDMADTLSMKEPPQTREIPVGTTDRTLEIAQPIPAMEKTQETAQKSQPQPAKPAASAAGKPSPKPSAPPFPSFPKKAAPASQFWIIFIVLAGLLALILAAAFFLIFKDRLFGKQISPTATVPAFTQTLPPTPTEPAPTVTQTVIQPTATLAPTETVPATQSIQQSPAETTPLPAETETKTPEATAGSLVNLCLVQPQSGQGLSSLINQFIENGYDPNQTYEYYKKCQRQGEKLNCEELEDLSSDKHDAIQIDWWIVIPNVDQKLCEEKGGIWY